jgi:hypothetical protein
MDAQRMANTNTDASKFAAHRKTVEALEFYLTEAGTLFGGRLIAPSVLSALTIIEEHGTTSESVPLSWNDRDKLLGLMMGARENILELVSIDHGKPQVAIAASSIDAACALLICWCDQDRFERPRGFLSEMSDRVRYLRNIYDNLVLQDRFSDGFDYISASTASSFTPAVSTKGRRHG